MEIFSGDGIIQLNALTNSAGNSSTKLRFLPSMRLKAGHEFQAVYKHRRRAADDVLILFGKPNDRSGTRLGLSVGRRVGGAVIRNRWKRVIREAFRLNYPILPLGWDFVVVPQQGYQAPALPAVSKSLCFLATRLAKHGASPKPRSNK